MTLWYQAVLAGHAREKEYLKIEKVHKLEVKRLVEEVNEAEFDQVACEEKGDQQAGVE